MMARGLSVDDLADRTRVPRSTILLLLGREQDGIPPPRTYLLGHLTVVARELGLGLDVVRPAFEASFPAPPPKDLVPERRLPAVTIAVAAGLGGIAILAVVIAFASALG